MPYNFQRYKLFLRVNSWRNFTSSKYGSTVYYNVFILKQLFAFKLLTLTLTMCKKFFSTSIGKLFCYSVVSLWTILYYYHTFTIQVHMFLLFSLLWVNMFKNITMTNVETANMKYMVHSGVNLIVLCIFYLWRF